MFMSMMQIVLCISHFWFVPISSRNKPTNLAASLEHRGPTSCPHRKPWTSPVEPTARHLPALSLLSSSGSSMSSVLYPMTQPCMGFEESKLRTEREERTNWQARKRPMRGWEFYKEPFQYGGLL